MSLSEIKQLVSVAFQAGRMDAQFEMGLRSDRIRRKDAECYLASKGFEKQMIDKWVKNRLMKEYVGDSKTHLDIILSKKSMNLLFLVR